MHANAGMRKFIQQYTLNNAAHVQTCHFNMLYTSAAHLVLASAVQDLGVADLIHELQTISHGRGKQ
jgi:hypothetical protein